MCLPYSGVLLIVSAADGCLLTRLSSPDIGEKRKLKWFAKALAEVNRAEPEERV